jgi:hypothetical protein
MHSSSPPWVLHAIPHLTFRDLNIIIIRIWRRVQVLKLLITHFFRAYYYLLSFFGPNILLISTLFSNTLRLCVLPLMTDQVPYPSRTTRKIHDFQVINLFTSILGTGHCLITISDSWEDVIRAKDEMSAVACTLFGNTDIGSCAPWSTYLAALVVLIFIRFPQHSTFRTEVRDSNNVGTRTTPRTSPHKTHSQHLGDLPTANGKLHSR